MTKVNLTEIVAIVDRSSSMRPLQHETIKGFNEFLASQKKEPGEALFTLALFSTAGEYQLVFNAVPIQEVPAFTTATYDPNGWTALLDAVGQTCNAVGSRLANMKEEDRPSKILVLIMTDGDENNSRNFTHDNIKDIIAHQRDKYSWEFVFIGANQDAITAGASIGIAATNSYNFVASAAGSASLFDNVTRGVSDYRSAVAGASYNMADPTAGLAQQAVPVQQVFTGTLGGVFNPNQFNVSPLVQPVSPLVQPVNPVTPTTPKSDK